MSLVCVLAKADTGLAGDRVMYEPYFTPDDTYISLRTLRAYDNLLSPKLKSQNFELRFEVFTGLKV